jgi:hypothetical protein
VDTWVGEQWTPKINGQVTAFASSQEVYIFIFLNKEEGDMIFKSGPYFMGYREMFMSQGSLTSI